MNKQHPAGCTAFEGTASLASGDAKEVARKAKEAYDRGGPDPILIFDNETSELVEFDLRGTAEDVARRLAEAEPSAGTDGSGPRGAPRGPGRPKLGVVAREVTLLPRHWDWLNGQPGGASAALRRLVEHARRANEGKDRVRRAQESAYRFMAAMAGNEPGFEEACRALFAGRPDEFRRMTSPWPAAIANHARRLAEAGFETLDSAKMPA